MHKDACKSSEFRFENMAYFNLVAPGFKRKLDAIIRTLPPTLTGPIARGAGAVVLLRAINVTLGLLATLFLARMLGAEGFGVFAFGLVAAATLSMVSRIGMQTFLVRLAARFIAERFWSGLNGVLLFGLAAGVISSIMLSALTAAVVLSTPVISDVSLRNAALIGAVLSPVMTLNSVAQALLRGMMKIWRAYAPEYLIVQSIAALSFLALFLLDDLTSTTALYAVSAGWIAAGITSWFWVARSWPLEARREKPALQRKQWLQGALLVAAAGLVGMLFGRIETTALAVFSNASQIGLYAIALKFAQIITFPGLAVSSGLAPIIANFSVSEDREKIQRRISLGTLTSSIVAMAAAVVVIAMAYAMLPMLGEEYADAWPLVIVLCLGFLIQTLTGRPFETLIMLGEMRAAALISAASAMIGLILLVALVHGFGAIGAAITTALIFSAHPACISLFIRKKSAYRTDIFSAMKAISA